MLYEIVNMGKKSAKHSDNYINAHNVQSVK